MACQQEYAERNSTERDNTGMLPVDASRAGLGRLLRLAEGTEIVGPIIMLVSQDLAGHPHVLELAFPFSVLLMLSPVRDLHPEAPQSSTQTIDHPQFT